VEAGDIFGNMTAAPACRSRNEPVKREKSSAANRWLHCVIPQQAYLDDDPINRYCNEPELRVCFYDSLTASQIGMAGAGSDK
jgi:hypothetical protein